MPRPAAPATAQAATAHGALPAGAASLLLYRQLSGLGEPEERCQPLAAERTVRGEGERCWAELAHSLHASQGWTPNSPGLPTEPQGPARLCAAAQGLTGTPGPVDTWLQSQVPLSLGSWAWDMAPQRDGKCCQEQADGTSVLSPLPGVLAETWPSRTCLGLLSRSPLHGSGPGPTCLLP